ncbi:MAG: 2-oxo-4-hydroxy-4-carboxy-5-ureidoimidazoline decarboxylase, partial [Candidatus Methylacidiphilales bacterium]
MKASLQELNSLPVPEFVRRLGGIFEHSPWVAEKVAAGRPYPSLEALHTAMVRAVQ